jgi:Enoyl-(Acyl carrier protein) reductase
MAVNATGVFYGMRAAIPALRRAGGGSIVNVASIYGSVGASGYVAYTASKGAVIAVTKVAALEHAHERIRVNAICPGPVRSPMSAEEGDASVDLTPLRRRAEPEESPRPSPSWRPTTPDTSPAPNSQSTAATSRAEPARPSSMTTTKVSLSRGFKAHKGFEPLPAKAGGKPDSAHRRARALGRRDAGGEGGSVLGPVRRRRAALHHRAHRREAREEHSREAAHRGEPGRPPARPRRARLPRFLGRESGRPLRQESWMRAARLVRAGYRPASRRRGSWSCPSAAWVEPPVGHRPDSADTGVRLRARLRSGLTTVLLPSRRAGNALTPSNGPPSRRIHEHHGATAHGTVRLSNSEPMKPWRRLEPRPLCARSGSGAAESVSGVARGCCKVALT